MKSKQEKQLKRINRFDFFFAIFGACLLLVIGGLFSFNTKAYAADLQPGEVRLTKTATPVANMVNQWDVTVKVEGKNHFPPPSTDVVLIIDTSASMLAKINGKTRLSIAQEAAKNFVNQVLKDNYVNRISLVTYADGVIEYKFEDGAGWNETFVDPAHRQLLIDKIDSLTAIGGTFTQGAIREATNQLITSKAINRNIVLLSDGVPTYSYDVRSPYNEQKNMEYLKTNEGFTYYATKKGIPEDHYIYNTRIGEGNNYTSKAPDSWGLPVNPGTERILANHAYAAIDEAGFSKTRTTTDSLPKLLITDFYTVGIDLADEGKEFEKIGQQTLKEIASSKDNYFDTSAENLDDVLSGIGGQIIGAMKKADIIDPMGKGFKLTDKSKIETTQGDTKVDKTSGTETISWDLDSLTTPVSNEKDETVFYAQMTYRVDANDDVIQQMDGSTGLAPTNGKTTIDYIAYDKEDEFKEKKIHDEFIVPTVRPTIVTLKKTVLDDKGIEIKTKEKDEKFKFSFGDDDFTKDDIFVLQATESIKKVHPWDAAKEYSITETLPDEPEYKTIITINDEEIENTSSKFTFSYDNAKKTYNDQNIHVINQRIRNEKDAILHIRQTVIHQNEELVVPSKGYYYAVKDNNLQKMNLVSGSTTKDSAADIEKSLFTTYKILVDKKATDIDLTDIVPEYYSFYGYILTTSANNLKTEHVSTNSVGLKTDNKVFLDYQTVDEYWLTMIIEPKFNDSETSPRPYSWSYKTNQFGN